MKTIKKVSIGMVITTMFALSVEVKISVNVDLDYSNGAVYSVPTADKNGSIIIDGACFQNKNQDPTDFPEYVSVPCRKMKN